MKILLLSAYDAHSHRAWHRLLQRSFVDWDWTVLSLPPRWFNWRVRGNSLSWAFSQRQVLEGDYDLVVATSMVDLSALRGFVPGLAAIPTLLYFHENQFAYPATDQQHAGIEPQVLSIYSALAADAVAFNSEFNRDSFLAGASDLLRRLPDFVPPHLVEGIACKSQVVPVPLAPEYFVEHRQAPAGAYEVVWNHRWEYDKGPDRLLALARQLADTNMPITLHVVGQQFRNCPPEFDQLREVIEASPALRCGEWGYLDDVDQYRQLLSSAQLVLSTAVQDFQGLSVLEAVAAGCVPLVPDRLSYPQWFAREFRYPSLPDDVAGEAQGAARCLQACLRAGQSAPDVSFLGMQALRDSYQALFERVAGGWPSAR